MDYCESDFKNKIAYQINILAEQDCEGCKFSYASFNDHTCHVQHWCMKVLLYFDQALQTFSLREDTKDKAAEYILCEESRICLKKAVEENGPSFFDI